MAGNHITQELMSKFELEFAVAEPLKMGVIPDNLEKDKVIEAVVESFEPILEELQRSFEFFSTTSNAQVDQAYLCGGGALIPGVDGLLADRLGLPVEIFDPLEAVKVSKRVFDQKSLAQMAPLATVAVGLATRRFDYK